MRESNTAVGDYVLSVLHQDEVIHYQIRRHGEDAFFSIGKDDSKFNFFLSYNLIMNYMLHKIDLLLF